MCNNHHIQKCLYCKILLSTCKCVNSKNKRKLFIVCEECKLKYKGKREDPKINYNYINHYTIKKEIKNES